LKGTLRGVEDDVVLLGTPEGTLSIPFAGIERARLVPQIQWRK
jgi:ribosome maturation factor RimP